MEEFDKTRTVYSSDRQLEAKEYTFRVPSRGDICPICSKGRMDYDGFLILTCPECGYQVAGGGFT